MRQAVPGVTSQGLREDRRTASLNACQEPETGPALGDAPGRIRTSDQQLRRLLLYPPELRARGKAGLKSTEADAQTRSGIVVNGGHGRHCRCLLRDVERGARGRGQ